MDRISTVISVFRSKPPTPKRMYWLYSVLYLDHSAPRHVGTLHKLEEAAEKQLINVAGLPFVWPHLAVMPDVHKGFGATVGSVIPTERVIIPAAVGVDIGCGMMARRLDLKLSQLPDSLAGLRSAIEVAVPLKLTDRTGQTWECLDEARLIIGPPARERVAEGIWQLRHPSLNLLDGRIGHVEEREGDPYDGIPGHKRLA